MQAEIFSAFFCGGLFFLLLLMGYDPVLVKKLYDPEKNSVPCLKNCRFWPIVQVYVSDPKNMQSMCLLVGIK